MKRPGVGTTGQTAGATWLRGRLSTVATTWRTKSSGCSSVSTGLRPSRSISSDFTAAPASASAGSGGGADAAGSGADAAASIGCRIAGGIGADAGSAGAAAVAGGSATTGTGARAGQYR